MLLNLKQRQKLDNGNDREFYSLPRFVNHVDERFINRLTNLLRDRLLPDSHRAKSADQMLLQTSAKDAVKAVIAADVD